MFFHCLVKTQVHEAQIPEMFHEICPVFTGQHSESTFTLSWTLDASRLLVKPHLLLHGIVISSGDAEAAHARG